MQRNLMHAHTYFSIIFQQHNKKAVIIHVTFLDLDTDLNLYDRRFECTPGNISMLKFNACMEPYHFTKFFIEIC